MQTLDEAIRLRDELIQTQKETTLPIPQVTIRREVSYYADYKGTSYALKHDFTQECVDGFIDRMKQEASHE